MNDVIFLTGTIDYALADSIIRQIMEFSGKDTKDPVWILIDSTGGQTEAAFCILDAMRGCSRPVKTCCIGRAFSSAGLLLLAGPDGRYSLPHGRMMLHQPKLVDIPACSMTRLYQFSLSLQKKIDTFDGIVAECTGLDPYSVEQELSYDHYFSPEEALEFHMIDEVIPLSMICSPKNRCAPLI